MKEKYHLKRLIGGAAWLGLATVLFAQASFGQGFISQEYRPRWQQEYENFAGYDLRKNPTYYTQNYATARDVSLTERYTQSAGVLSRATYDPFGNFLLPGGTVYNMNWDQSRVGASTSYNTAYFQNVFSNLMVSADEFSNWQTQFMIARTTSSRGYDYGGMRAFITPSTMKITNFGGLRWDFSSRKNNVSLFVKSSNSNSDTTLYGVHWQSVLGDVLKIGGTFVTHQRSTTAYSNIDIDENIKSAPRYVYLVLTDDSPEDTDNGARIYDVKVLINGTEKSDIPMRAFKIPDILSVTKYSGSAWTDTYIFSSSGAGQSNNFPKRVEDYISTNGSWFLAMMNADKNNSYPQIFSKTTAGSNYGQLSVPLTKGSSTRYWAADMSEGYLEATGTAVVVYEFLVPYETRDLKFNVLAANDYNLDIVAPLYNQTATDEPSWDTLPFSTAWNNGAWSVTYDSKTVAKARGNVKDTSNMKWLSVQYDRVTGMSVYGLNMELNWRGLHMNGEINEYNAYSAYPVNYLASGESKNKVSARAWFVNMEKDFGRWGFGGEAYNYPYDYMRYFSTVDDNDDNDNLVQGAYNESTEYPGLDVDWDRNYDTSDNNKPFLEYYYDDVVFGDDFNHNGTIDARENDSAPDYPYETGSYGHHFFVKLKPRARTLVTAGYYDLNQETKDGRNLTEYLKLEHFQGIGSIGEMSIQHRMELIQYNSFNSYRFGASGSYRYTSLMDSMVNTTLIHTRIKPIRNLNIINDVLTKVTNGYGDDIIEANGTVNEHLVTQIPTKKNGRITKATFIHKADYTWTVADRQIIPDVYIGGIRLIKAKRIKELKLQPMFKIENAYATMYNIRLGKYFQKEQYTIYPILRVDYQLAPKTKFRCGFQGFPGWEEIRRIRDVETYTEYSLDEYNKQQFIIAVENRSLYQGFSLVSLIGVRKTKTDYIDVLKEDSGMTQYFFTIQSEARK